MYIFRNIVSWSYGNQRNNIGDIGSWRKKSAYMELVTGGSLNGYRWLSLMLAIALSFRLGYISSYAPRIIHDESPD